MIKTSEALLLRSINYGEADKILVLLTEKFGKISGIAKGARKSLRRFGGRLEPFVHFRLRFRKKPGLNLIEDCEVIEVFSTLRESVELFSWGSFILETTDALFPEDEPNKEAFSLLVRTLQTLDKGISPIHTALEFQLRSLSLAGYEPSFEVCVICKERIGDTLFSIKKGGVVCAECAKTKGIDLVSTSYSFIKGCRNIIKGVRSECSEPTFEDVKLLKRFTEYHTEKELKSSKFLEEVVS